MNPISIDVFYSGTKPNIFAHEREAKDLEHAMELCSTTHFWWINHLSDYTNFDFTWTPPDRTQFRQRHAWPSQHQKDGGTYYVPKVGYVDTNYRTECVVPRIKSTWGDDRNFDYTWHPDPTEPPLIYQFGTQWQKTGGPRYEVPSAVDVKYLSEPKEIRTTVDNNWIIPEGLDKESFDYTWHPDDTEPPFIYQFGTQWQKTGGPQYIVPGATDIKYIDNPRATRIAVDDCWKVPPDLKIQSFDFTWHPDTTEPPYIYEFNTQHQLTGGPQYCVPGATEIKYLVQTNAKMVRGDVAIYEIDHGCGRAGQNLNVVKTVAYFSTYLDTLIRIVKNIDKKYKFIWVCSSICDYTDFDFTWHPQHWQEKMLHVFPSNGEKFGDTFYVNVEVFLEHIYDYEFLEQYDLNFVGINVPRYPMPVIKHSHDSHVDAIKENTWAGPLALFTVNEIIDDLPTVPLWERKTKTVVLLSPGASQVIVPKNVMPYLKTQVYDYPYIDKTQNHIGFDQPLDIVFIDNGERNAELNYLELLAATDTEDRRRIYRSSGVNGRAAAYKAAAELSTTPWFFAVFAKLRVDTDFDWSWQPDRLQEPKHYIFHAFNPNNGLTYGHQAMIAYNKKLVLENTAPGLDFTLDQAHEVVPILSGTAEYCDTKWSAWRTAFRECIKLKCNTDVESKQRLDTWLNVAMGLPNGQYSIYGAQDAVEYYDSVNGEFTELKKSYDWEWLASYAFMKRNLLTNQ